MDTTRLKVKLENGKATYWKSNGNGFPFYEVSYSAFQEMAVRGLQTELEMSTLRAAARFTSFKWV